MDHKLSPVLERAITLETDSHNGRTWQAGIIILGLLSRRIYRLINLSHGGNESAENFRRVVSQFIHGNRDHTSQALQSSVDGSQPVSIATSVATSVASSRDSTLPQIDIKAENQDPSPPKGKKRAAESSTLSRKLATQQMHRKRLPTATAISTKIIHDTIQYLQTVSDHILISDTISSREWATMHLATQLLQSRYEDIIAREEETEAISDFYPAQAKRKDECRKSATADKELYD